MADATNAGRAEPAEGREIGSIIAAVFGLVFVGVNSGGLPTLVRVPLLVVAGLAFVLVLALIVRNLRGRAARTDRRGGSPFGRTYWVIVAIEAVALFVGARLVAVFLHPDLGVAWVSFVVGVHFFSLGWLFRRNRFHVLAVLITACGLAGFVLGVLVSLSSVAVVSGVVPGLILIGAAIWALAPRVSPAGAGGT